MNCPRCGIAVKNGLALSSHVAHTGHRLTDVERFWCFVDKRGTHDCWPWAGAVHATGYGHFGWAEKQGYAHRAAWELLRGPVAPGLVVDHLCRNRVCVNPSHLEPVTQRENVHRGESPLAINARKTHCIRGHEFTPENTKWKRLGRNCRTCDQIRETARRGTRSYRKELAA